MNRWELRFMFWIAMSTLSPMYIMRMLFGGMAAFCAVNQIIEQREARRS